MHNAIQSILHYKSNWLSMWFGLLIWAILLVFGILFFLLANGIRLYMYDPYYYKWDFWSYFFLIQYLFFMCYSICYIVKYYWPSKWNTTVQLNLGEKELELEHTANGKTEILPFEHIDCIVYRAVSPIFVTYYLYWVEIGGKRKPLVAFIKERNAQDFFERISRAGLRVLQKTSAPS